MFVGITEDHSITEDYWVKNLEPHKIISYSDTFYNTIMAEINQSIIDEIMDEILEEWEKYFVDMPLPDVSPELSLSLLHQPIQNSDHTFIGVCESAVIEFDTQTRSWRTIHYSNGSTQHGLLLLDNLNVNSFDTEPQIAFDAKSQVIYVFARTAFTESSVCKIDLKTNKEQWICKLPHIYHCPIVYRNNKIYVIDAAYPIVIDLDKRQQVSMIDQHMIPDDILPLPLTSKYIPENDSIISIVGTVPEYGCYTHGLGVVSQFNMETKKNTIIARHPMFGDYHSKTKYIISEDYVIMFGNTDNTGQHSDEIHVLFIKEKKIKKCLIECPFDCNYYTVRMGISSSRMILAIHGFVREFLVEHEMEQAMYVFDEQLNKIMYGITVGDIHVFTDDTDYHWKVSEDDILSNLNESFERRAIPENNIACSQCNNPGANCLDCNNKFGCPCKWCGCFVCFACIERTRRDLWIQFSGYKKGVANVFVCAACCE